jgi:pimeloyl-ACP methyl ester carboxylesterase
VSAQIGLLLLAVSASVPAFLLIRLFVRQDRLIFRPGPLIDRPRGAWGPYEDVHLTAAGGETVLATWMGNPAQAKVVIFFHGSEGNVTHELPTIRFLRSLKVRVLAVEYPGYPYPGAEPPSRRPYEKSCYRAADAAWDFIVGECGLPPDQVILFGLSLGGAVAAYLATSAGRQCGGLVLQSTFTSVPDLAAWAYPYLPVRPFCRTRMNTRRRIGYSQCNVLIAHSPDDEHIPFYHAQRLYEACAGGGGARQLVELRGSHFGQGWHRSPSLRKAWEEMLGGRVEGWAPGKGGEIDRGDNPIRPPSAQLPTEGG